MSKAVFLIELDLDKDHNLREILKELDPGVQVRPLASKTFDEYDRRLDMDYYLGA